MAGPYGMFGTAATEVGVASGAARLRLGRGAARLTGPGHPACGWRLAARSENLRPGGRPVVRPCLPGRVGEGLEQAADSATFDAAGVAASVWRYRLVSTARAD
jgi:hypothetical protein